MKTYPVDLTIRAVWAIELDGRVTVYLPEGLTAAEQKAALRRFGATVPDDDPEEVPDDGENHE